MIAVQRPARRALTRRQKLMLLAAFEIMVAGFTQATIHPYRPGVAVEIPVIPGHVIV
ncbi:MAG: hypothetical protein K2Y56_06425 [Methylobacterium sp.]|uniref:hypothetical protein n=1 Tax=Methylobacterium sp. TaxID=409 RepID=UPI0025E24A21|nr:hypothetical protein [Methylobacterium sp.]MBX9931159.1 hypothetical protein [Methylobacterium sp.]